MSSFVVGLRTHCGQYLTVETFGGQFNSAGKKLLAKQKFTMTAEGEKWSLRANTKKYLGSDHREVKCDAEAAGESEKYELKWNNGVVTFKNFRGKFLSCKNDEITVADAVGATEEFEIVLTMLPQVCFKAARRFLGVTKSNEVSSVRDTQFGKETVFTLKKGSRRGAYVLEGFNGNYWGVEGGKIVCKSNDASAANNQFAVEFHQEKFALKALSEGKYCGVSGAGVSAKKDMPGKAELFEIVQSNPQITLTAFNGKLVSNQGANLMCNRAEVNLDDGDFEVFMLEFDGKDKYAVKTPGEKYWSCKDGVLEVSSDKKGPNEHFSVEWHDGKLALKGANGKYMKAAKLGGLDVKAGSVSSECLFAVNLENRAQLILLTGQGGFVASAGGKIWSNKPEPETFALQFNKANCTYKLQADDGKFWKTGAENRTVTDAAGDEYYLEIQQGKLAIRTTRGAYLSDEKTSGFLVAKSSEAGKNELLFF